jgi:DHA3 family macrolide efflux protein-like MFS transporter
MSIRHLPQPKSLKPFFTIWAGQIVSLLGSQLVQFALVWYLTSSTGSATVLALATMVALLPQIFLSPIAGALVDRWNRRTVMIVADAGTALATVALAALFWAGAVEVWHIYLLMFIRAIGGAFHWPAMQASTTLLVPEKHLSRIAGLNQSLYGLANIVSPPLGALLLSLLPMQSILAIDVGTAMLAIVPLLFIAIPNPPRSEDEASGVKPSVLADVRQGLRLVWRWPGLLLILVLAALLNLLLVPAMSLLPILVTEHFGGLAMELAWTEAGWGLGTIIGGLLMGAWGGFKRRIVTGLLALVLMGAGLTMVGFAPATALLLAIAALFMAGAMNSMANGSFFAALQATVPPDMQGRIFTIAVSGSSAMAPLGLAMAGPLADRFGVQVWFVAAGLFVLAMSLVAFFIPAIMRFEEQGQAIVEQQSTTPALEAVAPDGSSHLPAQ